MAVVCKFPGMRGGIRAAFLKGPWVLERDFLREVYLFSFDEIGVFTDIIFRGK